MPDIVYVAMDETEFSQRGLALGRQLARQLDATLKAVSVVAETSQIAPRCEALQKALADQGVEETSLEVVCQPSAKQYLAELASSESAWLCMNAHGRRPITEMLIGSVTAGVVRRSSRPLYLCGPRYAQQTHRTIQTLMVCVDGSALSEAMLSHAVSLAKTFGARLQLLHVVNPQDSATAKTGAGDVMESGYVHGVAKRLGETHQLEVDWDVLHGDPADSIVSYVADYPDVMLAMTTHGRSGLSQVVAGSVSHEVVHEASCPVALFRPV